MGNGQGMPDISILESLSQILGVSIDEIIRGEKQKILQTIQKNKRGYARRKYS